MLTSKRRILLKKLTYGSFGRDIRLFFALAANLVVRAIS